MNLKSAPNDFDERLSMHLKVEFKMMFEGLNTEALTFQKDKHFSIYRFLKSGAKKAQRPFVRSSNRIVRLTSRWHLMLGR